MVEVLALQEGLDEPAVSVDAKAFKCNAETFRRIPRLTPGREDVFRFLWSHDIPIVVTGVQTQLKGLWTPAAFVETHGEDVLTMITVTRREPSSRKVTVREFFHEFTQDDETRGCVVKVKVNHSSWNAFDYSDASVDSSGLATLHQFFGLIQTLLRGLYGRRAHAVIHSE